MIKSKKNLKNKKGYNIAPFYEDWIMKLDGNESVYEPPRTVVEAIKNINISKISHYPAYGELKQAIAGFYNLSSGNIIPTNGADEAISLVCQTFLEKGEKILTASPTFVMSKFYSELFEGKCTYIPYKKEDDDLLYPYEKIEKSISCLTKIILFTTPNNPTGDIINKDFIEEIAQKYPNKIILIDETYSSYSTKSYFDLVRKYENVIVIKSFSKDFALAGLRLGFIATSKDIVYEINKVKSPYNVNSIAIIAGIEALKNIEYLKEVRKRNQAVKNYLYEELELLGAKVYKSYANFILIDFKEKAKFVYLKLLKNGIITKFFEEDKNIKNHIRMTIPKIEDAIKIIEILKTGKLLVFDMDGVLIDVQNSYRKAIIKTVEYFTGDIISEEEIKNLKLQGGYNNDWDISEYFIKKKKNVPYSKIVKIFQKFYWDNGNGLINEEKLLINPSILKEIFKNFDLAIFTGRPKLDANYTLELNEIKKYFHPIITMDDVGEDYQKPDTKGLELIKERTFSKEIVYLGDTKDDMICGKNAKIKTIGILPPQDKSDKLANILEEDGAILVLDDVNKIKSVLEIAYENKLNK